jgi:hypothetical protein
MAGRFSKNEADFRGNPNIIKVLAEHFPVLPAKAISDRDVIVFVDNLHVIQRGIVILVGGIQVGIEVAFIGGVAKNTLVARYLEWKLGLKLTT